MSAAKSPPTPKAAGAAENKTVIWEGLLKKKKPGGLWESWQTRYFRVYADMILYYGSKGDTNALGLIPIQTIKSVDYDKGRRGTTSKFNINVLHGQAGRVFDLEGTQQRDTDFLVDKLQALVKAATENIDMQNISANSNDKFWKQTGALEQSRLTTQRQSGIGSGPLLGSGSKTVGAPAKAPALTAFDEDDPPASVTPTPSTPSGSAAAKPASTPVGSKSPPPPPATSGGFTSPPGAKGPPALIKSPTLAPAAGAAGAASPPMNSQKPPPLNTAQSVSNINTAAATPSGSTAGAGAGPKSPPPVPLSKQPSATASPGTSSQPTPTAGGDKKPPPLPPGGSGLARQPSKLPVESANSVGRAAAPPAIPNFSRPKSSSNADGSASAAAAAGAAAVPPSPSAKPQQREPSGDGKSTADVPPSPMGAAGRPRDNQLIKESASPVGLLEIGLPTHDTPFGKVFRARIRKTDDFVLLHAAFRADASFDDAKALHKAMAKVQSPYVFRQLNAGETSDTVWAAYTYPPYHSLLTHLRANRRFPEKVVRYYAAQAVSLFAELHKQGLICRNLSPETLYLDASGRAVVCDFFIASTNTKKMPPLHATEYESPEYVSRGDDDRASDWWRLGVLMYELAVGFPPIRLAKPAAAANGAAPPTAAALAADQRDMRQLIQSFQTDKLRFPPFVSAEFKDLCSKLLVTTPSKRLGSKVDDAKDVMAHAFFTSGAGAAAPAAVADIDWAKSAAGALPAPGFVIEKLLSTVNPKPSLFAKAPKRIYGDAPWITSDLPFTQFFSPTLDGGNQLAAAARRAHRKQSLIQRRFVRDGFDLDLSYITPRLIVMAGCTDATGDDHLNSTGDVLRFLKTYHDKRYRIANLNTEVKYDKRGFEPGAVVDYATEPFAVPSFESLIRYCEDVSKWLTADANNIAVTHCRSGIGRSGMFVCCYLLFDKTCATADAALSLFAKARRTDAASGLNLPSQRRYVKYFEQYLNAYAVAGKPFPGADKRLTLTTIRMTPVPNFETPPSAAGCDPYFVLSRLDKKVFHNQKQALRGTVPFFLRDADTAIGSANGAASSSSAAAAGDGSGAFVDIRCNVTFYGDAKLSFYDCEKAGGDKKMCWLYFNPNFVDKNYLSLTKDQIEGAMRDVECRHFPSGFKLELYFSAAPATKEAIALSEPDPALS